MEINACLFVPGLRFCAFCCCEHKFCHFEPFSLTNNDRTPGSINSKFHLKKKPGGRSARSFILKVRA